MLTTPSTLVERMKKVTHVSEVFVYLVNTLNTFVAYGLVIQNLATMITSCFSQQLYALASFSVSHVCGLYIPTSVQEMYYVTEIVLLNQK
jgi:tryptophan synthase alpha subunit